MRKITKIGLPIALVGALTAAGIYHRNHTSLKALEEIRASEIYQERAKTSGHLLGELAANRKVHLK